MGKFELIIFISLILLELFFIIFLVPYGANSKNIYMILSPLLPLALISPMAIIKYFN